MIMKTTNSIFSFKRFGLLFKRELIMKQSFLLMASIGVIIAITGITLVTLAIDKNYRNWGENDQFVLFAILFSLSGIVFSGTAFPAFRNSKKTMDYLLIPNSLAEKYMFEVLFRIFIIVLVFPLLFWIGSNLAAVVFNSFTAYPYDLDYNMWLPFRFIHKESGFVELEILIYALVLFVSSIAFTGAAFFSKVPLLKTIIFIAVFIGASLFYGWILDEIFDFTHVTGFHPDISEETGTNIMTAFLLFSILALHVSAFFRLKEKEV